MTAGFHPRRLPSATYRHHHPGTRFPGPWLLAFALSLPLAGCSGEAGSAPATDSGVSSVTSDSAGVAIVTSEGTGWDDEAAWRLEPDLQLGELDGPLAFGQVSFVGPGSGSDILVVDRQSALVHAFSDDGQHLRSFGGEGEGPGEFQGPRYARATADGRIAVAQTFPPILHWVTEDGEFLERWRIPDARNDAGTMTAPTFGVWMVTEDGTAVVGVTQIDPGDDGPMSRTLLTRYAADPGSSDGVTLLEWSDTQRILGPDDPIPVLEPRHTWDIGPGAAVAISQGSTYEVRMLGADGALARIVRRTGEPIEVDDHIRQLTRESVGRALSEGGAGQDMVDSWLERLDFPDRVPAIQRVWFSVPDGALWVGVFDEEGFRSERVPSAWDVFDGDGIYLGRVPVPDGFTPHTVTESFVYGVWEDELEVPFARRYRILRPEAGPAGD